MHYRNTHMTSYLKKPLSLLKSEIKHYRCAQKHTAVPATIVSRLTANTCNLHISIVYINWQLTAGWLIQRTDRRLNTDQLQV